MTLSQVTSFVVSTIVDQDFYWAEVDIDGELRIGELQSITIRREMGKMICTYIWSTKLPDRWCEKATLKIKGFPEGTLVVNQMGGVSFDMEVDMGWNVAEFEWT